MNTIKLLLIIAATTLSYNGKAADTLAGKYPRAVLVQLKSEHNRIEALTREKQYNDVALVKREAGEVRQRMINDFTDNYSYCPVYYYLDTNADLIRRKKFADVLFDKDGYIITNPVINSRSDNYVIVYYGYAISQSKSADVVKDTSSKYTYDPDSPPGKGLIVLDDEFQQIDNFFKLGYDEMFFFFKRKRLKKYFYSSKKFDMEYYPFADLFQRNFGDRYSRHHIQPTTKELSK